MTKKEEDQKMDTPVIKRKLTPQDVAFLLAAGSFKSEFGFPTDSLKEQQVLRGKRDDNDTDND